MNRATCAHQSSRCIGSSRRIALQTSSCVHAASPARASSHRRSIRHQIGVAIGPAGRGRLGLRHGSTDPARLPTRRGQSLAVHAIPPTAEEVFNFENIVVFPLWLAMILAPNAQLTKRVLGSDALFISLALIYAYLTTVSFQNPAILEGFSSGGAQDLAALTRAFSFPETVAVGWAHFIAQDLLVGRFIWADGRKNDVFTAHSLLLTLFFGPLGALSHIATRAALGKADGDVLRAAAGEAGEAGEGGGKARGR